ncbi:MAG TPA: DUF1329 domain-containing protein [Candidatus Binataceae bacterium]|jgi:hypothetical protein|nr:DUF1329 domain-containing protein [Candidatus Binataceae bacterium]
MRTLRLIAMLATVAAGAAPAVWAGQDPTAPIPPGTTITMQNWQQYQQYMPDGMVALFQGRYFWKMPEDVSIEVGPTLIHPLPKGYRQATEQHSAQTTLVKRPDGQTAIAGYQGGRPFPNPSGADKGWKILANMWFRYMPHLIVDTYGLGCLQNSYGSVSCSADTIVLRQLSYNTDPGVSATIAGASDKYFTEWVMTVAPENKKYNASLTISYSDITKQQDTYVFIPSLRRYQPVSAAARCSQSEGYDVTSDDYRFGFNGVIGQFQATFLGKRKILALTDYEMPKTTFPEGFDMPLGWPEPAWGKWQVRDVDVIDVRKIPSMSSGYCYGKRIIYVDEQSSTPLWEELYDSHMQLWKIVGIFARVMEVPQIGPVNASGSEYEAFWDIKNNHATYFIDPSEGNPFYFNDAAPKQYQDVPKYTTPGGLGQIMR